MHQQPNKLWSQVLTKNYVVNGTFLDGKKVNGSYVLNSIIKFKYVLWDGFSMRIGSSSCSFWYDPWMKFGPLCNMVTYVNIQDTDLLVKDINRDGIWNLECLAKIIPQHVKDVIN